ncbi:MAG: type I phosphomannose isomerase catalytic subunit [Verrucomicrobiota bacterium]
MDEFIRFQPLNQERVWGGRALATALGRTLPPGDRPIGESWEIVDRPEAQSVVVGGAFDGLTLRQVRERHSAAVMGPRWPKEKPFPILVKWLDCRERLSLQVHPPAAVAKELGGEPKTENWFVAAAEPGAHLIVGLKPGVTREKFEAAVAAGTVESCVNRFPVAAGDSVLVRSGTVHAIDGGNLILEIQQNSDTTYRVDDWGRLGLDGKPRQLHVAESLQAIFWDAPPPMMVKSVRKHSSSFARFMHNNGWALLANTTEFSISRISLLKGDQFWAGNSGFKANLQKKSNVHSLVEKQPRILSVVKGRLTSASGEVKRGDNVLLPYAGKCVFTATEDTLVLVTDNFTRSPAGRFNFQMASVLFVGRKDGITGQFDDRALLHMSTVALLLSTMLAACQYFHWPVYVYVQAFALFGLLASPSCLVLSIWEMIRRRCTLRTLLAAGMGAVGTLVGWGAVYLRATGMIPLNIPTDFLN